MDIINIIEQKNGIIESISSYAIWEPQLSTDIINQAEKGFKNRIKELYPDVYDEEELDAEWDAGDFDDNNGRELAVVWSEI